jgi:hypothetical protein
MSNQMKLPDMWIEGVEARRISENFEYRKKISRFQPEGIEFFGVWTSQRNPVLTDALIAAAIAYEAALPAPAPGPVEDWSGLPERWQHSIRETDDGRFDLLATRWEQGCGQQTVNTWRISTRDLAIAAIPGVVNAARCLEGLPVIWLPAGLPDGYWITPGFGPHGPTLTLETELGELCTMQNTPHSRRILTAMAWAHWHATMGRPTAETDGA